MSRSQNILALSILAALVLTLCVWYAVAKEDRQGVLTVSFLDVGQGDSIFIDAPSGRQVLIDGGSSARVVRELGKRMPWWDRSIDVLVPTHPDADHITGLIDVLARYKVGTVVRSSVAGDTQLATTLDAAIRSEKAEVVVALRGQIIDLGGSSTGSGLRAYLEVLSPDRDVRTVETNTGSVVLRLVYGKTAFMLTGDAPQGIEKYLVYLDDEALRSDVLKAGHHGSKTSSAPLFLGFVNPAYAVFSRGCDNRYGHPAPEVVERFKAFGIPTLDTCEEGTITFVSDGQTVRRD